MSNKQPQKGPCNASVPIVERPICENPSGTQELPSASIQTTLELSSTLESSDIARKNVPVHISEHRGSEEHEHYTGATFEYPVWTSTVPMTTQRLNGQDYDPKQLPTTQQSNAPAPAPKPPEASPQPHGLRISRNMESAIKEQEELVELRERTLTERLKLERKRKQLREVRMKAGDTEAQLITQLWGILEQYNIEFPPKLLSLYKEVQAARDILGGLDDDYNQAESEYGTLEWTYSNRESKFYQKYGDANSSSSSESSENQMLPDGPEAQYSSAVGEVEMLREQLSELQREHAEQLDEKHRLELYGHHISPEDESFLEDFPRWERELLRDIEAAELKVRQFQDNLKPNELHQESRRASDTYLPTAMKVSTVQHVINTPQSESAVASLVEQYTATRKRISDWILESLKSSHLEKARLKAQFGRDDLDDDTWWKLVVQHWNQDEPDDPLAGKKFRSPSASRVTANAINPSALPSVQSSRAWNHAIPAESASNQAISMRDETGLILPSNAEPIAPSQFSPLEDLVIPVSTPNPEKMPEVLGGVLVQSPLGPASVPFEKQEILETSSLKDNSVSPKTEVPQLAEPNPTGTYQPTTKPNALPAPASEQGCSCRDIKTAETQSPSLNCGPHSDPGRSKQSALEQLWPTSEAKLVISSDNQSSQENQSQIWRSDSPESCFDNRYLLPICQPGLNPLSPPPTRTPSPRLIIAPKYANMYPWSHICLISNHGRSRSEPPSMSVL